VVTGGHRGPDGSGSDAKARRAVVLVGGPVAPYSRALRIGRALAAEGFNVEIAAVAAEGLPSREAVRGASNGAAGLPEPEPGSTGAIGIRRYAPSGPWAFFGASEAASGARVGPPSQTARGNAGGMVIRIVRTLARPVLALRRWLFWPHSVRGWWATLHHELAAADLYHACGSLTIAAALAARRRSPIGPSGMPAVVIYDLVDEASESNTSASFPRVVRNRIARLEAGWAADADAVTTASAAVAERVAGRWRLRRTPTFIANSPEPPAQDVVAERPDLLRAAAGLESTTRVVLFHGRLGPDLGLDAAAEAILAVPDAALVLLGFGRGLAASRARDAEPGLAGRHVTLDARHPDELLPWIASADVALIPLPPISLNQQLTTPNKFWEALAAGTPVVVVRGLTSMVELVEANDLGTVARSPEPEDLAIAIRAALDRVGGPDGPAWRRRIAEFARGTYGWPAVATTYRSLVRSLLSSEGSGPVPPG
jgi:glycosyltransferase involved in cell wall biosynthesis